MVVSGEEALGSKEEVGFDRAQQGWREPSWKRGREEDILGLVGGIFPSSSGVGSVS